MTTPTNPDARREPKKEREFMPVPKTAAGFDPKKIDWEDIINKIKKGEIK